MSQPKKDIADFFRPLARSVPRKRSNPGGDEGRSPSISTRGTPSTPNADRKTNISNTSRAGTPRSPTHSLVTPKSGRSVAIPFRSPSSATPSAIRTVRKVPSAEEPNLDNVSPSKPSATQSSSEVPSSSLTVFEDGKRIAVRDSDDSDDSLRSLSELIGRKKDVRSTISSSQPGASESHEQEGRQLLNLFSSGRSEAQRSRAKLRELQKRELANKVDLSYIYEDERKDTEFRERIAKWKAEEHTIDKKVSPKAAFRKKNLATVLKGSDDEETAPEGLNRLLHAVDRTETLSTQMSYTFFSTRDVDPTRGSVPSFPATAIPGNLFEPDDKSACRRMFLSGFMSDLAYKGVLDDDAIRWTFDMISEEQREDILEAYLGCVSAGSSRWTRANIGPADVQSAFEHLGVHENVFRDNIEPKFAVYPQPRPHQCQLLVNTLKLFCVVCEDLDFASLSRLCSTICRLLIDEETMNNNKISKPAHHLIQCLLDLPDQDSRRHVHARILADMGMNLKDPILQAHFLQNLVSTSPPSLQLRAELATTFLYNRQRPTKLEAKFGSNNNRISTMLIYISSSTDFSIRSISNLGSSVFYTVLHALTIVLDAAIGDGSPPVSFLDRNEEQLFNFDVDSVAHYIDKLYSSIPDSGASHMTRTEAKNALLDLHHRLTWAVRTRQKKRRQAFDHRENVEKGPRGEKRIRISDVQEVEEQSKKRDFMARFLHKKSNLNHSTSNRQSPVDEDMCLNS